MTEVTTSTAPVATVVPGTAWSDVAKLGLDDTEDVEHTENDGFVTVGTADAEPTKYVKHEYAPLNKKLESEIVRVLINGNNSPKRPIEISRLLISTRNSGRVESEEFKRQVESIKVDVLACLRHRDSCFADIEQEPKARFDKSQSQTPNVPYRVYRVDMVKCRDIETAFIPLQKHGFPPHSVAVVHTLAKHVTSKDEYLSAQDLKTLLESYIIRNKKNSGDFK